MNNIQDSLIVIYSDGQGRPSIEVMLIDETVWLTQAQIVELYDSSKANVSEHIKNIFADEELSEKAVVRNIRTTATDGKSYLTKHYNLDMIISLGYRINSKTATRFRQWATQRLSEYISQGFTMNDEFLKNNGGGAYWRKLLARIRDIRSSEKILYRQVLDLYATSSDYDPKSLNSIKFFKIVQNKLHYAVHNQTAAEVIHSRADSAKKYMGLTVFAGDLPVLDEVRIAKNYLTYEELDKLNRLVSAYFELAELRAIKHQAMSMADHIRTLDNIMGEYGDGVLQNSGKISHGQAIKKAEAEYRKYQQITLSGAEQDYLDAVKLLQKKLNKRAE